jgi:hypothetical protein
MSFISFNANLTITTTDTTTTTTTTTTTITTITTCFITSKLMKELPQSSLNYASGICCETEKNHDIPQTVLMRRTVTQ